MDKNFIKAIKIRNFKCFEEFSVSAKEKNVIVGPNNAGKSTVLDSIRIASDVLRFSIRKRPTVRSQPGGEVCASYKIPSSYFSVDLRYFSHNYNDEDGIIEITLASGARLGIRFVSDAQVDAYLVDSDQPPQSGKAFRERFGLKPVIVPTLSPLEQDEPYRTDETVEKNRFTRLSSRSFRNIWRRDLKRFEEFSQLVSFAWPGIRLNPPEFRPGVEDNYVDMYFRDGPSVREVQWSGFGFQVWMQMMTHIMRADSSSTLVLDEPDIYLHPDLQHKLIEILDDRVGQYFIATHSTEIINEAETGTILSIGSNSRSAKRVKSQEDYSGLFSLIGSSENVEFARLARARRVLFFEGNDLKLFRRIAKKLGKEAVFNDADTAYLKAGGFGQFKRVESASWLLQQLFTIDIKVASIFDRDWRSKQEISDFLQKMNDKNLFTKVLPFKEIENSIVMTAPLERIVLKEKGLKEAKVAVAIFEELILAQENDVKCSHLGEYTKFALAKDKSRDPSTITKNAFQEFDKDWAIGDDRRRMIGGKGFLSSLFSRIKSEMNVSLSYAKIISEMRVDEFDPSFVYLLDEVEAYFDL